MAIFIGFCVSEDSILSFEFLLFVTCVFVFFLSAGASLLQWFFTWNRNDLCVLNICESKRHNRWKRMCMTFGVKITDRNTMDHALVDSAKRFYWHYVIFLDYAHQRSANKIKWKSQLKRCRKWDYKNNGENAKQNAWTSKFDTMNKKRRISCSHCYMFDCDKLYQYSSCDGSWATLIQKFWYTHTHTRETNKKKNAKFTECGPRNSYCFVFFRWLSNSTLPSIRLEWVEFD